MIRLIYVSSATRLMGEDDLIELLDQARNRNERQGVTGMLLYADGNFMQVLEGNEKDVDEIYNKIVNDERNKGHIVIEKESIKKRSFPDWSMGFKNFTGQTEAMPKGYSKFLQTRMDPEEIALNPNEIVELLYEFKKYA